MWKTIFRLSFNVIIKSTEWIKWLIISNILETGKQRKKKIKKVIKNYKKCIAKMILKFVNHALIANNRRLLLFRSKNLANVLALEDRFNMDTNVGAQILHLSFD